MKLQKVIASNCRLNCEVCGLPTEFDFFESGVGGSFETYLGAATRTLYRVDVTVPRSSATYESMYEIEGGRALVIKIPEDLKCRFCGGPLVSTGIPVDGESFVEAVLL